MTRFSFKDPDGDELTVYPIGYPRSGYPGMLFSVTPVNGRNRRSVWLPDHVAHDLARALVPGLDEVTEHEVQVGHADDLVPRAEYSIGGVSIVVEGTGADSPAGVAKALVRVLRAAETGGKDSMPGKIVKTLCEMLDCEPAAILTEFERRSDQLSSAIGIIDQQRAELSRRPTADQLQQAERAAEVADRRVRQLQQANEALGRTVEADTNGIGELRGALRKLGLQGMATAPLTEIAERVAALGAENSKLREQVLPNGLVGDEQARRLVDLQQEVEAGRVIAEQLDRGLQRERELHKQVREQLAAETARHDQTRTDVSNLRAEAAELSALRVTVAQQHGQIARHEDTVFHYQELLTNARKGLTSAGAELTEHAAPDDELDVRVLNMLVEALESSTP
jgi:hypothetical protein